MKITIVFEEVECDVRISAKITGRPTMALEPDVSGGRYSSLRCCVDDGAALFENALYSIRDWYYLGAERNPLVSVSELLGERATDGRSMYPCASCRRVCNRCDKIRPCRCDRNVW